MDNTVMVAIISGLCVGIPSLVATITSNNKAQALINYKIEQLDKKVEKHNKVIERTFKLEEEVHVLEERVNLYHHD